MMYDYLARARLAGMSHPLPPKTDETALARLLLLHNELRRKGVTLELLRQEQGRTGRRLRS